METSINTSPEVTKEKTDWKIYFQTSLLITVVAIIVSLPVSVLCALLYRFPMPMAGYDQGIDAALYTPLAWLFVIVLGGVIKVFAIVGFLAGLVIFRIKDKVVRKKYAIWTGSSIAVILVLIFASLDLIF